MVRNPPPVKKQIRATDGFFCAHPDCFVPYLEYHHFDPPWVEKEHNDPNGIIGLCPAHHRLADGKVYKKEMLREWKTKAPAKTKNATGNINWLRQKVAITAGPTLYYENTYDIMLLGKPMIWFKTSPEGYRLMNLEIPGLNGKPLIKMVDNDWEIFTKPSDLNCIPSGKQITITFPTGEFIDLRFKDINDPNEFRKNVPQLTGSLSAFQFPLCLFSLKFVLPSLKITFDNDRAAQIGGIRVSGGIAFFNGNITGLSIS